MAYTWGEHATCNVSPRYFLVAQSLGTLALTPRKSDQGWRVGEGSLRAQYNARNAGSTHDKRVAVQTDDTPFLQQVAPQNPHNFVRKCKKRLALVFISKRSLYFRT